MLTNNKIKIDNLKHAHSISKSNNFDFNCWGTTLYILGETDYLDWVYSEDMIDFLESKTNNISNEDLQIGDILALYSEDYLIHTAVYLGKGLYFHKMGASNSEFTQLENILNTYPEYETIEYYRLKKGKV